MICYGSRRLYRRHLVSYYWLCVPIAESMTIEQWRSMDEDFAYLASVATATALVVYSGHKRDVIWDVSATGSNALCMTSLACLPFPNTYSEVLVRMQPPAW